MRDLCVPIPVFDENEHVEITLDYSGKKQTINYRVETFLWDSDEDHSLGGDHVAVSLARIERLKNSIREYDKGWELIQIFTPAENARTIQVLYRKKRQ